LPTHVDAAPTAIGALAGYYDYAGSDEGIWHVNFADPRLFVAYGSPLLAQDELQPSPEAIRGAVRVLKPPSRTNLIAMPAPFGQSGPYLRHHLDQILMTAYTGFAAAPDPSRHECGLENRSKSAPAFGAVARSAETAAR
jgi:hypothetical protein